MTPPELLNMAHAAGLTLWADGGRLRFKPAERLTPELRGLLVQYKPAVLDWLATRPAANDTGAPAIHPLDALPAGHRWCWPAAPGQDAPMNADEVHTFTTRALLFMRRGLTGGQADALAGKLKARDREGDPRRVCLECQRLTISRTCATWWKARIGSDRPGDLLTLPQRCPAFAPALTEREETP